MIMMIADLCTQNATNTASAYFLNFRSKIRRCAEKTIAAAKYCRTPLNVPCQIPVKTKSKQAKVKQSVCFIVVIIIRQIVINEQAKIKYAPSSVNHPTIVAKIGKPGSSNSRSDWFKRLPNVSKPL